MSGVADEEENILTYTKNSRDQAILQTIIDYRDRSIIAWLEYERRVDDPCCADRKKDNMANANAFYYASQMLYQLEEDVIQILNTEGDLLNEEI